MTAQVETNFSTVSIRSSAVAFFGCARAYIMKRKDANAGLLHWRQPAANAGCCPATASGRPGATRWVRADQARSRKLLHAAAWLRKWSPKGGVQRFGSAERQSEWFASARCFAFCSHRTVARPCSRGFAQEARHAEAPPAPCQAITTSYESFSETHW